MGGLDDGSPGKTGQPQGDYHTHIATEYYGIGPGCVLHQTLVNDFVLADQCNC